MEASFESKEDAGRPIVLDQKERSRRFGLECIGPAGDGVVFKAGHWTPGGEYVQKLIVRNVSTTVKKFKYKLPSTRYFSLAYPEVIILSPGMFREIDVIFRPVEYNPYDDTLYIQLVEGVGSGGFHVSVRATIDKLILTSPYGLDLGFCPTHQTTSVVFQLTNSGEVDAPFRWQQTAPFVIEPEEGVVPVGQSWDIRVSIFPTDASVFVSAATCIVGEGVHAIIPDPMITTRISAIGKYTYIAVSEGLVDFGQVLSGTPPEATKMEILLRNNSVVPAEFELLRHESDTDEVFDISPRSGVLPPQSGTAVTIKYSALSSGCFSLDRYTYKTPGGCTALLTLQGMSVPSVITAFKETSGVDMSVTAPSGSPANSINFRDIEVGRTETRVLFLRNDSKKDSPFNILCGGDGIFKVSPKQGVIPAQFQQFPITLTFSPPRPINYYRRVFMLIGDNLPLFYDAMGSGFIRAKGDIKEQRPAPLRFAHVQAYRNRQVQGVGGLSPPELDDMYAQGSGDPAFFASVGRVGTRALAVTSLQSPLTRTGEATRVAVAAAHELFIDDTDGTAKDLTVNKTSLDFGFTPYQSHSDPQTIVLTNNTRGKVCVVWEIPLDMGGPCAFQVDPPTLEIGAGASAKCRVTFKPQQSNRNFLSELEAFVYFKNQRTFRLVNDSTLTPPWCLAVQASGHTFASGQLLATIKLTGSNVRRGKLVFPTCFEGESSYQTFMLRNTSNLPSIFRFELGFGTGTGTGTGGAGVGVGSLKNNDFGGSFGGTLSSHEAFSLTPMSGEVGADNFVLVSVRFSPSASKKYTQLVRCIVNGDFGGKLLLEGNASVPFAFFPDVQPAAAGVGNAGPTAGGVSPSPQHIPRGFQGSYFLQPTHVGLSSSRRLVLKNGSRLPLRFRLLLPPEAAGIVSITPTKGLLRGNESISIVVAFAPKTANRQVFKLRAKTYPVGGRPQRVVDARQAMGVAAPDCMQTLSLYLVAPGDMGAVVFSPAQLAIDVRLVYTSESRDICLENVSDSDLQYEIHYVEEFTGDLGGGQAEEKRVTDLRLITTQSTGTADINSLFCEAPTGTLLARSRKRVVFTYQPIRAGLFDFKLYCRLKAIDPRTGEKLMLPNEETALMRTHGAAVALPLVTSISSRASFPRMIIDDLRVQDDALVGDIEHLWRQFNLAALNFDLSLPLTDDELKLNGSVSTDMGVVKKFSFEFPHAVVGSPKQNVFFRVRNSGFLPCTFHLHLPNEKQLDLEQWCDEDDPSEDLNKIIAIIEELKCFSITPHHATLQPGEACDLVISYSFSHLKYGGVHRLPVHVKLEQGKQFMLDLVGRTLPQPGCFGANAMVSTPASNKGPITDLTNRDAVPPTDLMLTACLGANQTRVLVAVPIGLPPDQCPLQRVEVFNVGACDVSYDVSLAPFDAINESNWSHPIFRVANPSGVIPARSSICLEIYFCPLETTLYELPILMQYQFHEARIDHGFDNPQQHSSSLATPGASIQLNNMATSMASSNHKLGLGGTKSAGLLGGRKASGKVREHKLFNLQFSLQGKGYDSRQGAPPLEGTDVVGGSPGPEQLVLLPQQLASLSQDLVDFGTVPQGCSSSRLVVLRSLSLDAELEFSVDDLLVSASERARGARGAGAGSESGSQCPLVVEGLLTVFPASGRLGPGEQVVLELRLEANSKPLVLADRLRLTVREVVKGQQKRRGADTSASRKALSRVLGRKVRRYTYYITTCPCLLSLVLCPLSVVCCPLWPFVHVLYGP